jgi:hypothetical protein
MNVVANEITLELAKTERCKPQSRYSNWHNLDTTLLRGNHVFMMC